MSKRFTDTEKWKDGWFLDLSVEAKVLFMFLCDYCDIAGFHERHDRSIAYHTGIDLAKLPEVFKELEKSVLCSDGVLWLRNFLRHQKNLPLNQLNNAHKSVIKSLIYHIDTFGSDYEENIGISIDELRGLEGSGKGLGSPIGRGRGKGKGKDKGNGIGKDKEINTTTEVRINNLNKAFKDFVPGSIDSFKHVDVEVALNAMVSWVKANPEKSNKKNWKAFVNGWLSREEKEAVERGKPDISERNLSQQRAKELGTVSKTVVLR